MADLRTKIAAIVAVHGRDAIPDRIARAWVKAGALDPTPADIERITAAEEKRARRAARRAKAA